jgi:glycosyltransferase involved in cell wall biosynthesis
MYRGFDEIHATSPGFLPLLERQSRTGSTVRFVPQWVPRGLSNASRDVRVPLEPDRLHFTYAGNLGRFQNLENVILGFERARRSSPGIQLNVVGTGSEAGRLRQLCRERGIDGVVFWGQQPQEEVRAWLRASQVLVLPLAGRTTLAHTIPAKFQAYLRACRPLLAAAVGEVARITREEHLGIAVDPDRVEEIAEGFNRFAASTLVQRRRMEERIAVYDASVFNRSRLIDTITASVFRD